jgi:hypothetical protein
MTSGRRKATISAVNVIDAHAIPAAAADPARWTSAVAGPSGSPGFHVGPPRILVVLLVLGGLGYGVSRLRRGRRAAPRDDEWTRREPPPDPPAPLSPPGPSPDGAAVAPDPGPRAAAPGRYPDEWALETSGLTKRFGANAAVNDVELRVPRGSTFGYLGPNGAGNPVTGLRLSFAVGSDRCVCQRIRPDKHHDTPRVHARTTKGRWEVYDLWYPDVPLPMEGVIGGHRVPRMRGCHGRASRRTPASHGRPMTTGTS